MTEYWDFEPQLSGNSQVIFEHRYLRRVDGKPVEKPIDLLHRVARAVASAEASYGASDEDIDELAKRFYMRMAQMQFLPNSPTLMNAGREQGQLSACFVLPVPDTMEGIFDALKAAALIHKSGGGTGFDFSELRPRDSAVASTGGLASGPVSFMKVFNAATEAIKQGGVRRGANMGMLRVDHPDIREFISCKQEGEILSNFNISVAVTDDFMNAVENDEDYELSHNGISYGKENAMQIWNLISTNAWKNGEPGIIFIDRINSANPCMHVGTISATNPCGEQPLLPWESCNLGSINLALMVKGEHDTITVDYSLLAEVVDDAIRFLDNVIDINTYPLPEIRNATLLTRKIGLGIMGFADLLLQLKIPYDSELAVRLAEELMSFIQQKAVECSETLATQRGVFPAWEGSSHEQAGVRLRNSTLTTIAPTGSISMLAGCSSGIEPLFAVAYTKTILNGTSLIEINPFFAAAAQTEGFYSTQLMEHLSKVGRLGAVNELPERVRRVFITAQEIAPEAHIAIQTAFQRFTDNAVSKTINFANDASVEQVRSAFFLAYQQGLKGLTVYRDGSRSVQVYSSGVTPAANTDRERHHRSFNTRARPEVTKGEIEKFAIGCGSLYVMSSKDDIGLTEVFCEPGKFGGCESQSEATGRLISYCLRLGRSAEEVELIAANIIEQLRGIRCPACIRRPGINVTSCPDAIARSLQRQFPGMATQLQGFSISSETQMPLDDISAPGLSEYSGSTVLHSPARSMCPDCGQELIPEGGCWTCRNCGFSKCS